jgi:hypothetical protein
VPSDALHQRQGDLDLSGIQRVATGVGVDRQRQPSHKACDLRSGEDVTTMPCLARFLHDPAFSKQGFRISGLETGRGFFCFSAGSILDIVSAISTPSH